MFADFCDIKMNGEEAGVYTFEAVLNPEHAVYEGHFPGLPVTPGVCLLRVVKECASRLRNRRLRFERIISCKFLAVVDRSLS